MSQENYSGVAIASAAQTAATVNSDAIQNNFCKGAHICVNVSAFTSGTYTVHVQGFDPASEAWYDILVSAALAATGLTVLKVYPGEPVTANVSASDFLPQTWRVSLVGATTPSMTLSVGYNLQY